MKSHVVHVIGLALAVALASCTGNRYQGQNKKEPAKEAPKEQEATPQPQPPITPPPVNPYVPPVEPSVPEVDPNPEILPEVPDAKPEIPEVDPEPLPKPKKPEVEAKARLIFPVQAFQSMENRCSAIDEGFRVIIKDTSGKVIAAGPTNIQMVQDGKKIDAPSSQYGPVTALNARLAYISDDFRKHSEGTLHVCLAKDQSADWEDSACQRTSIEDRAIAHTKRTCQYPEGLKVKFDTTDDQISVHTYNGRSVKAGGAPVLITNNPLYAPIAGEHKTFNDVRSPLVLRLDGQERLELLSAWDAINKALFDFTGKAEKIKNGWIAKNEGFLALDTNKNGMIDDGSELFGEYSFGKSFDNGFLALATLDSNQDGRIDAHDKDFDKLLIWQDHNKDGISQPNELKSLRDLKIESISLAYKHMDEHIQGNHLRMRSTFRFSNQKVGHIYDVWFESRSGVDFEQAFNKGAGQ
jgi:hypothetical protein